jgi:hypothetical protein
MAEMLNDGELANKTGVLDNSACRILSFKLQMRSAS